MEYHRPVLMCCFRFAVAQWSKENPKKADFVMITRYWIQEDGQVLDALSSDESNSELFIFDTKIRLDVIHSAAVARKVYNALVKLGYIKHDSNQPKFALLQTR